MTTKNETKLEATFTKSKETKGTWMFLADADTCPVSNIYFSKVGLDKIGSAEKIKVTIEAV